MYVYSTNYNSDIIMHIVVKVSFRHFKIHIGTQEQLA